MTDENTSKTDVAPVVEEEGKQEKPRKKSMGALDPAPVLSGPRQRKKAEHYQVEVKEKADFIIKPGKGVKLGEIPNAHYQLGKLKTDDELLTGLHNLLFRRPGTANRRKKNLYEFSGLTFEEGDKEKELEKLRERLGKWTIALLNSALDAFDLPRGNGDEGKKESKVERLLAFLEEPKKLSEKDLAAEAAKKKDAAKAKKEKEQKAKTPKSAAKSARKSEAGKESAKRKRTKKEESEDEEVEEQSEEAEEEEPEPEPEPEPPKKKAKKEPASAARTAEKKPIEKKVPSAKKSTAKKTKPAEEEAADGGEADEATEPAAADKVSDLPSDDEIRETTLALLKVSDVNTTTVKDLLKRLKEKFGKDLASKKHFVKEIAVEYANAQTATPEPEVGESSEKASEAKEDAPAGESAASAENEKVADAQQNQEAGDVKADEAGGASNADAEMVQQESQAEKDTEESKPESAGVETNKEGAEGAEGEAKEGDGEVKNEKGAEKDDVGDKMEVDSKEGGAAQEAKPE